MNGSIHIIYYAFDLHDTLFKYEYLSELIILVNEKIKFT